MVLSRAAIEQFIKEGKIGITPLNSDNFKEASYTFTLKETVVLEPGEFKIVLTTEKITLSHDVCCFLSTRGSIAQMGVDALQSSAFVEPGSDAQLKLELCNNSTAHIALEAGTPIVKGVFMKVQ